MSSQTLRQVYSASSNRQAMARAIRAEIEGGEKIIDDQIAARQWAAKTGIVYPPTRSGTGGVQLTPAGEALAAATAARNAAEDVIRAKYNMPPMTNQAAWRTSQKR